MTKRLILGCAAVLLASVVGMRLTAAEKSPVADAVERGDKTNLQSLLAGKADVNATQLDGTTALHWAIYRNDVAVVDQLLKAGAKVSIANRQGITPLYMASLYGNSAIVSRLLKAGADAKALGPNSETMLMLAARNGNPEIIKMFVAAGADVNAREPIRGTTALMWAAEQRHPEAVKALTTLQSWDKQGYVNPATKNDGDFAQGKSAISWVGHWAYNDYRKALGDDLVLIPMPRFGAGMIRSWDLQIISIRAASCSRTATRRSARSTGHWGNRN